MDMIEKTCTLCAEKTTVQTIEDFSKYFFKDKKGKHKHNARCKKCCRIEKKKLYAKHPEKMNPNYTRKSHIKKCAVCDKDFLAREEKQLCCSDKCKKFKNKVRAKIRYHKEKNQIKKDRLKEIKTAKTRYKHYSQEEKDKIIAYLDKDYTYGKIAKKLGRTSAGIGKVVRRIKIQNYSHGK